MKKAIALFLGLMLGGSAWAHTGHGTHSLMEGLAHPLGWDHLLAMVAVGLWSVAALPAGKRWQGPAAFVLSMVLAAGLGASGVQLPGTEYAIALSVSLMGVMLLAAPQMPPSAGLSLIVLAASFHGLAHGAELPVGGVFAGYALGFVGTTALLHLAGLGLGAWAQRLGGWAWRVLGAGLSLGGLALVAQI